MLNGGGSVAFLGLKHFVGHPFAVHITDANYLPLVCEQDSVPWLHFLRVCVQNYREAEECTVLQEKGMSCLCSNLTMWSCVATENVTVM